MARPSKLTPEIIDELELSVRKGLYLETAASVSGISRSTLHLWLKEGARIRAGLDSASGPSDEELSPHAELLVRFSDTIKKALAQSESETLEKVAGAKAWQAHAWRLERRFPQRWSQRQHVTHDVDPRLEREDANENAKLLELLRATPDGRNALEAIARGMEGGSSKPRSPFEWGDVEEGETP